MRFGEIKKVLIKIMETNEKKICSEVDEFSKKVDEFESISLKAIKDVFIEKTEIRKFITEQELKNIDVILDILKLITSLSISIFVASLTTAYFNEKIHIIIFINLLFVGLLAIFIDVRKDILEKNKKILLEIFEKSDATTRDGILAKAKDFKSKCNIINTKLKELNNEKT